jgi:hypothetical protein
VSECANTLLLIADLTSLSDLVGSDTHVELAKQASQISMYDIKSYYNQAKNAVLNVSEMEAKVREATNDDSW